MPFSKVCIKTTFYLLALLWNAFTYESIVSISWSHPVPMPPPPLQRMMMVLLNLCIGKAGRRRRRRWRRRQRQSTGKVRTRQPQRERERNCCPFTRSLSAGTVQRSLSLSLLLFLDLFKFFISVASSLRKVDLKGVEGDRWMDGCRHFRQIGRDSAGPER